MTRHEGTARDNDLNSSGGWRLCPGLSANKSSLNMHVEQGQEKLSEMLYFILRIIQFSGFQANFSIGRHAKTVHPRAKTFWIFSNEVMDYTLGY